MTDSERILSQQEVDALLRAISAGEVPVGGQKAPPQPVTPLDFRRPQRLSRREMRALESIHEPLARALRDLFGPILRAPVEVKLAGVEQLTYAEFADSVPSPTAIVVVAVEPGERVLLLEADPALVFPVVERMLGAGGVLGAPPERPLREIEWNLLDRVFARLFDRIAECWAGMTVARLSVRARETNPHAARALLPDEAIVRLNFSAESEGRQGAVNLCLPSTLAEQLVKRHAASAGMAGPGEGAAPAVAQAEVDVAARLPAVGISLADLEALARGDVLLTGLGTECPVAVEVGGIAKLGGRAGSLRGRRAVLVEDWLDAARAQRLSQPGERRVQRRVQRKAGERKRAPADWSRVLKASVELRAVAASRAMTLREVLELRPGMLVGFARGPGAPIMLEAGGKPFAAGAAVRVGDRVGVQIESVQEPQKTVRSLGKGPAPR